MGDLHHREPRAFERKTLQVKKEAPDVLEASRLLTHAPTDGFLSVDPLDAPLVEACPLGAIR